ncbi:MAG: hypothetical protein KJ583_00945 [Nanoarchaeota archaeon]|nr:hypothetical protein [Nanoarchaeota archaeon]MBU1269225.1 hypothetical protein [Nanoarchaeota archaeon]MBU1603857.1 hypothetical protein [Nanoarchaeota archaeon]MBU2443062.1 hypothetical protein [Nanoarchaeota archaeon]
MVTSKGSEDGVLKDFERQSDLSKQELKELLLINTYKLALVRAQMEALTEVLIKHKVTTYEEIWKKTNENFKESSD